VQGEPTRWIADPARLRQMCEAAVRALIALPAGTPSLRLLADHTAEALAGISHALNGLALLVGEPARPVPLRLRVPDWLPSLVNAGRAFVTIGAVELFWIITAWPNGAGAITFAAIVVLLSSARADQAYANAMSFMIGVGLAAAFAAIIQFAVLPGPGDLCRLQHRDWPRPGARRRAERPAMAEGEIYGHRRYRFRFARRSGESDELRHSAIL
jgi:uncharacterized membrane protein YccC